MKLKYFYYVIFIIIRFIFLLCNHLKKRWNIDKQILIKYSKSLIYAFFIALVLDLIYMYYIIFDNITFNQIKIRYFDIMNIMLETVILSIIIFIKRYLELELTIERIKYILFNFKFIFMSYTSILRKYNNIHKKDISSNYNKYLEFKLLNIIIYQIFKFYFKNIAYLEFNYISKCIYRFFKLYQNKESSEFQEFYTIIFFNPLKKEHLTHYQTLYNNLKRQIVLLLRLNSLFVEDNEVEELIGFSLNQWFDNAIKYNIQYIIKKNKG